MAVSAFSFHNVTYWYVNMQMITRAIWQGLGLIGLFKSGHGLAAADQEVVYEVLFGDINKNLDN